MSRDPQLGHLPGLSQYQAQAAALTGHLVADTLLYPLETVLHRLHLQGTRSIIDNLDSGIEVTPILTRYEGVADCFSTILQEEGISGLFKGFGAVMLQYVVHFLVIKFSSKIISQVAQLFSDSPSFLQDPRLGSADDLMSAPASNLGATEMESGSHISDTPRMSKNSITESPSSKRRKQIGSTMPQMAPRSFNRETRENTLLTGSGHDYSFGGSNKKSLNEIKESNETGAQDS